MSDRRRGALHANERAGAHAPSLYAATAAPHPDRPALDRDLDCDAVVIGAGYTGLSAALHLARAGREVVVIDAHRLGWGASGRNGGQVGIGFSADLGDLEAALGLAASRALFDLSLEARAMVKDLAARFADDGLDCGWRDGVIYASAKPGHAAAAQDDVRALADKYGYQGARYLSREALRALVASDAYHGGAHHPDSGHLHPLNFAIGLGRAAAAAGARLFERTEARRITRAGGAAEVVVDGAGGARRRLRAQDVVLAVNGFADGLDQGVAAHVAPINNYVAATAPLGRAAADALIANGAAVADTKFVVNYFRIDAETRLIFGGGESYGARYPADLAAVVRPRLLSVFPQLAEVPIDYAWGGTLAITPSRLPYLARLGPGRWTAGGFSGHGVAMATVSGALLADAILGRAERFERLAALPTPRFPGGAALQRPLLALAMLWYSLRDRF